MSKYKWRKVHKGLSSPYKDKIVWWDGAKEISSAMFLVPKGDSEISWEIEAPDYKNIDIQFFRIDNIEDKPKIITEGYVYAPDNSILDTLSKDLTGAVGIFSFRYGWTTDPKYAVSVTPPPPPKPPPPPTVPKIECDKIPLPGIPIIDQLITALCWVFSPLFNLLVTGGSAIGQYVGSAIGDLGPSLGKIQEGVEKLPESFAGIGSDIAGGLEKIVGDTAASWSEQSADLIAEIYSAVGSLEGGPQSQAPVPHSPLTTEEALLYGQNVYNQTYSARTAVYATGVAAEFLTLGQVEEVAEGGWKMLEMTGLPAIAIASQMAPWTYGISPWVKYHYQEIYSPSLLPAGVADDLYRKGIIPLERWYQIYKWLGFSSPDINAVQTGLLQYYPDQIADKLLLKGRISVADWTSNYKVQGYPNERIALIQQGLISEYDHNLADRLLLRGSIDDKEWSLSYSVLGYPTERIAAIKKGLTAIPGPGDLIRMLVRETISVEEFAVSMSKLGYGFGETEKGKVTVFTEAGKTEKEVPRTASLYWNSHWIPPDSGQLFDMRRRGLLNDTQLLYWLSVIDVDPRMINNVAALRFRLPSRIESRLIYETTGASDEELTKWLGAAGLEPTLIPKFLTYVKGFPARTERRRYVTALRQGYGSKKITKEVLNKEILAAGFPQGVADWIIKTEDLKIAFGLGPIGEITEKALTKSELFQAFRLEKITEETLRSELESMGYSAEEIDLLVDLAKSKLPKEPVAPDRAITKSEIEAMFKNELLTPEQTRGELLDFGYDSNEVDLLMALWNAKLHPPVEPLEAAFNKGDLETLLSMNMIPAERFRSELADKGYDGEQIAALEGLVYARRVNDERNALRSQALTDFVEGYIDEGTLRSDLSAALFSADEISLFIQSAVLKRDRDRNKDLVKIYTYAYQKDLLNEDEFRSNLASVGLLPERVEDIIALENIRKVPKPKAAKAPPSKDLTLAQLFSAWKSGLLSEQDLAGELVRRGYSEAEAQLLIDTEIAKETGQK
jgi:hypothetical protein